MLTSRVELQALRSLPMQQKMQQPYYRDVKNQQLLTDSNPSCWSTAAPDVTDSDLLKSH